jgi:hypothetical protein
MDEVKKVMGILEESEIDILIRSLERIRQYMREV